MSSLKTSGGANCYKAPSKNCFKLLKTKILLPMVFGLVFYFLVFEKKKIYIYIYINNSIVRGRDLNTWFR